MLYVFMFIFGVTLGGVCAFLILLQWQRRLRQQSTRQHSQTLDIRRALEVVKGREEGLKARRAEFEALVISYDELKNENTTLKQDLQNVDVNLRKLQMDRELQGRAQSQLDQRAKELGKRYLKENVKWIGSSIAPSNYAASKQRLINVISRCRQIGYELPRDEETGLLSDLKVEFENVVRAAYAREEQARIKAQIREEQRLEKEIERELKQLERERAAVQAALEKALAEAKDEHSEEIERLRAKLAEAEERSQRAISRAQMTKSGHVYVISNIGSFGEGMFKIGMTRRLEPADRIRELSSASVPFRFDVHMMISSDDAPTLENSLHRALHQVRVNKANPRKEFFESYIETIREIVEKNHGKVEYVADPEALEYRQSLGMTDEDLEYIETVYEGVDEESEAVLDDEPSS